MDTLATLLPFIQPVAITLGGLFALWTYWGESKRRRSEWMYRLYSQFYESDRFKYMRRIIDYRPADEIAKLKADVETDEGSDDHEALADYLNFFEFIAIQRSYGNIKTHEILDMFEYYLRRMKEQNYLMAYIQNYGYEHLESLLKDVKDKP
ncbi:DUF4760 domain-containing protein [Cognatishimia activa]|uniref:DUF4760 domain-containing protein n=1 Tax=Cognatishimia activa TaxID=1715691 RepID=A0A0N7MB52_9RHOB|nr:hypothetical protein [Cognatishimia activa]CUI58024.1 hypothetical protein TA5113_00848 [Cognatishimia activa]CUK24440.1 hypothetical protein TA5114_00223 [Cognatishimia activa]